MGVYGGRGLTANVLKYVNVKTKEAVKDGNLLTCTINMQKWPLFERGKYGLISDKATGIVFFKGEKQCNLFSFRIRRILGGDSR